MTEVGLIDAEKYAVDIRKPALEASESRVYKGVDFKGNSIALKIYKDHLTLKQLQTYQEVTNDLAERHNDEDDDYEYVELAINGKWQRYKVRIVPIQTVGLTKLNPNDKIATAPCAISEFVEGYTLFDLEPSYISSRADKLEKDPLVQLGAKFRRETRYKNLSIIPWNVKVLTSNVPPTLAITDIIGGVSDLQKQ